MKVFDFKFQISNSQNTQGFTLVELVVVIAILGILSIVLLVVIDPLDKVRSANDAGVISTITQFGKANDVVASQNSGLYISCPSACDFTGAVLSLNARGESKFSSVTPPLNYTYVYLQPPTCDDAAWINCLTYAFYVNLQSKKYAATPYYVYANGKGCFAASAPVDSTFTCL